MATDIAAKVQEQIARDRAALDRELAGVEDDRARAFAEHDVHFENVNRLSREVIALDDAGQPVPDEKSEALNDAHAAAMKSMTRALGLGTRARNIRERRDRVGSASDVAERTATAERLAAIAPRRKGPGVKGPSMRSAAIIVLLEHGPAAHFREITRLAQESGLFKTKGKTPAQTMSAMLSTDKTGAFKKVAPGVYELADPDKAREEVAKEAVQS